MNTNNNASIEKTKNKLNVYTTASVAIALVLLILANMFFEAVPKKYTQLDISADKIYTLSSKSTDFLKTIDEEIIVYCICVGGSIDNQLMTFLNRYEQESKKISVVIVDPYVDTTFIEKYSADYIDNYSLIVESAQRYRIVNYKNLNYYYNEKTGPISASEYEQYLAYDEQFPEQFVQYFGGKAAEVFTHYFGGEVALTGAIEYVVGDVKKVYSLTGHSESEFPKSISQQITYVDIATAPLNLKTTKKIPSDATTIIINVPKSDITEAEATLLLDYINNGGDLFVSTDTNYLALPNLLALMNSYGLSSTDKAVADGANFYDSFSKIIDPHTNTNHKLISSMGSSDRIYLQNAHGINISETLPENFTSTELLYTSDSGYYSDNADEKSKITLGAIVENESTGSNILWVSSGALLSETFSNPKDCRNSLFFVSSLLYFGDVIFNSQLPKISPIKLESRVLDVSNFSLKFWAATFIFVIPVSFIVIGIVISLKRKSR